MQAILEFGIARNMRVVMAKLWGVANVVLDAVWRLFGRKFHKTARMSVYGVPMTPNFRDKTFRYCLYGTYGKHLANHLDTRDTDFVFIDIGANQGLYSLIAARNPRCRSIIAFEPVRRTFELLAANIALNQASDRSDLINAGFSDHSGAASIAVRANHSGVASLAGHKGMATETIRLIDVAQLDRHIPEDLPIVVKIDVEGHEGVVISELLKSAHFHRVTAIFHEMDERWTDAGRVRQMLQEAGFARFTKYGIRRHYDVLAER